MIPQTGACASFADTVHSRFVQPGLTPGAPSTWTVIRAAGDPPAKPGTKGAVWDGGGSCSVTGLNWVTLGDYAHNSGTEYLFWTGSTDPTVMPYDLAEGLSASPDGVWSIAADAPGAGLCDVQYGCQRCPQLGTTVPISSATSTGTMPNPAATVKATLRRPASGPVRRTRRWPTS